MIPNQVASDDTPHSYTQSFPSGLPVHGVRQPSLPYIQTQTIDPRLLGFGGAELPSQHNVPDIPICTPEREHYQTHSPIPPTSPSAEIWMGYRVDGPPTLVHSPSPISPSNMGVTYATHMDSCICARGCGQGPCVPQRVYDRQRTDPLDGHQLKEMILFSVGGKCGYPLASALKKAYTNLDGRDEKVFNGFKSSISIRLEWLPYEKWTKQIRTLTWKKPPDYISRSKLATEVAKRLVIFFEEMRDKPVDPSYHQYRVQPGVIDIDHLELVALKRVAKSSYMPHFRLIDPHRPRRPPL